MNVLTDTTNRIMVVLVYQTVLYATMTTARRMSGAVV